MRVEANNKQINKLNSANIPFIFLKSPKVGCNSLNNSVVLILGKVGPIIEPITTPIIYPERSPRENFLKMASFMKEANITIDRLADLSRVIEDPNKIKRIKLIVKYLDKFITESKYFLYSCSKQRDR